MLYVDLQDHDETNGSLMFVLVVVGAFSSTISSTNKRNQARKAKAENEQKQQATTDQILKNSISIENHHIGNKKFLLVA